MVIISFNYQKNTIFDTLGYIFKINIRYVYYSITKFDTILYRKAVKSMTNKLTRKERVYQVVQDLTKKAIAAKNYSDIGMDAYVISIILKIERSNASKELNDLWREGRLIKIQGRPILYLSLEDFINAYPIKYIPTFIPKGKQLSDYLEAGDKPEKVKQPSSTFDMQVGAHGSLIEQILSAKAAINYPPYGLPTLLCGNLGIGKMQFAHDMYDYALDSGKFNTNANFVIINCMDYANNAQRLRLQLFGSNEKRHKNLIEQANGGILFFDEVQKLDSKGRELLIDLIHKGTYTKPGESHLREVNAMILASTTEEASSDAIISVSKYFPVIINLPDIDQRDIKEKIELILSYFSKEAKNIKMPIRLSKDVLFCFVQARYKTNITQLRSEIKLACSRAYLDIIKSHSRILTITFQHLSNDLLNRTYNGDSKKKISLILNQFPNDNIFFDEYGNCNDTRYLYEEENNTQLLEDNDEYVGLSDYTAHRLSLLKVMPKRQQIAIKSMLTPIAVDTIYEIITREMIFSDLGLNSNLFIGLILQVANAIKRTKNNIPAPFTSSNHELDQPSFLNLSNDIVQSMNSIYNIKISEIEKEGICDFLSAIYRVLYQKPIGILVVSHGSCIAQEMVRFVNPTESDKFKIEALDYGYEESLKSFLPKIYESAQRVNQGSGVLIVTDMIPFASLQSSVHEACGIKTAVLTGLNLPMLIKIVDELRSSVVNFNVSLDSFENIENITVENESASSQFIQRLTDDFLDEILTFINPKKAVNTLLVSLNGILDELHIQSDESILVKYITHTTSMLERVIRKEPLGYQGLKSFTKEHSQLIQLIENHMRYVNETFGIKIPPSELAYIAEIFIPYIKEQTL